MRKIIALSALVLLAACKKETESRTPNAPHTAADSSATLPKMLPADGKTGLRLDPLEESAEPGKTIFTQAGKTIIAFDTRAQKGSVKLNGKIFPLNTLTFSENNYEIKGQGIEIIATDGDFAETVSDCGYGSFPQITVKADGKEAIFKNIKVQDCPDYQ